MPEPRRQSLKRSVESLVAHRQSIRVRERALVGALNRLLRHLGYAVVPQTGALPAVSPPPRRRAATARKASRAKTTRSRKTRSKRTAKVRQKGPASNG